MAEMGDVAEVLETEPDTQSFDYKNSEAWEFLQSQFGPRCTHKELRNLTSLLVSYLSPVYPDVKFTRSALRTMDALMRWYQDNLNVIKPFILNQVVIERYDGQLIGPEAMQQMIQEEKRQTESSSKKEVKILPI